MVGGALSSGIPVGPVPEESRVPEEPRAWRWRRVGEPPKRLFLSALGLVGAYSLWYGSGVDGGLLTGLALLGAWFLLAVVWAALLAWALIRRPGRERLRGSWRRWLVVPAIVITLGAATVAGAPLWARFSLSAGALEDMAVDVMEGERTSGGRAGLYDIRKVERLDHGALLYMTDTDAYVDGSSFAFAGFAYLPDGPPKGDYLVYEHLRGPWYTFEPPPW